MIRYCVPQGSFNPSLVVHLHPSEPFGPLQWSTMGPTGDKQRACELTAGVVNYHELTAGHKSTMNSQKTFKFLWLLTQGYSGLGRTIVGLATGPPRIVSEQVCALHSKSVSPRGGGDGCEGNGE